MSSGSKRSRFTAATVLRGPPTDPVLRGRVPSCPDRPSMIGSRQTVTTNVREAWAIASRRFFACQADGPCRHTNRAGAERPVPELRHRIDGDPDVPGSRSFPRRSVGSPGTANIVSMLPSACRNCCSSSSSSVSSSSTIRPMTCISTADDDQRTTRVQGPRLVTGRAVLQRAGDGEPAEAPSLEQTTDMSDQPGQAEFDFGGPTGDLDAAAGWMAEWEGVGIDQVLKEVEFLDDDRVADLVREIRQGGVIATGAPVAQAYSSRGSSSSAPPR